MEHAPLLVNAGGRVRELHGASVPSSSALPAPALQHATGAGGFGTKRIGLVGGLALIANNIFGPGLASLPAVFQQGGWLMCARPRPARPVPTA